MADDQKATKSAIRMGFRAGWAAACQTLAKYQTDPAARRGLADMALNPPEVEPVHVPQGETMQQARERVGAGEAVWSEHTPNTKEGA